MGNSIRIPGNWEHGFCTITPSCVVSVKRTVTTITIHIILIIPLTLKLVVTGVSMVTRGSIRRMICVLLLILSTMSCKFVTIPIWLNSIG